tara:strand:- start:296 stop:427 length:132 start_codon:yes stop_codon:yes gene_type:complete
METGSGSTPGAGGLLGCIVGVSGGVSIRGGSVVVVCAHEAVAT